ncbi:MAG: acetolactate synthase small subunit [Epsilonproteobacteria bacterium]|nr:acetolactate synthase small subunit [Campylobacterota bacterium]OIO16434.1 MAG: acetolactate synthase small subunit [Helicobacteraceae bacterium CG1_02_36_14]PIP11200.1 MAG: acetolactate synthase small subunit [Sulfurimonas sp. CG23_combo_of_CG06-09_8_20_14_all_36_33]PIS27085.1 MAG: acetolactate synthase small subunit [Sulfurimonas sp. CG08_land_8_20_14_0_20_36_33]PIU33691.1 MAG: acetolactate synthase small subunit [Sulfurimonas sp. CG07_land_8_20_14_0_80_36_56]PIV05289.1 MAG: acetolactate 
MTENSERRVISVIVVNEASVLSRITNLFSGRGYNITSLTVAPIPESNYSRLTIVTSGSVRVIEQITKQLHKLIPVLKVYEHADLVEKEMAMVKFPLSENLSDIDVLCRAYNGKIVNVGENVVIVMVADEPKRVDNFLAVIKKYNPKEIVRSGAVALER